MTIFLLFCAFGYGLFGFYHLPFIAQTKYSQCLGINLKTIKLDANTNF
jgi:hypothetical protein